MRSLVAKLLVWSLVTFATSLVAFWLISKALERRGPDHGDFFLRSIALLEDDACQAYEDGGPAGLAVRLRKVDSFLEGTHRLTDRAGRDLVTGEDHSEWLRHDRGKGGPAGHSRGQLIFVGQPRGGRYRFVTLVRPLFNPWWLLPYYGAVLVLIALLVAILAVHLAAPLRRLRRVVDRFGQGDLSARSLTTRRDEIGDVARAFDQMAGRIETLLFAERRLLQDVSHELRSPLARLGFAIENARSSHDLGAALDRIKRDVGRLTVLVDELLELTRAEGDPGCRERAAVRLDELVGTVVEDCALEAEAKGCRIDLTIEGPVILAGEAELLRRAAENVVRNATRYAPEGSAIEVRLRHADGQATLTVRDRGVGVPDNHLESIFTPFFRIEGDRSRSSGGVGLGLAITRRSVALHGGRVTARNAHPGLFMTIKLPTSARTGATVAGPFAAR